jgi:hypothetical protein
MNKFVFSALATTLVGASSFASDTEWPELDSELAALNNAPLTQDASGPAMGGWLIGTLTSNSDTDTLGFNVAAARVNLSGSVGSGYGYMIGFDFADDSFDHDSGLAGLGRAGEQWTGGGGGVAGITDAYGTFAIGEGVNGKMGVFRMPFLRSNGIDRNNTLFVGRSSLGGQYSGRDAGLSLSGEMSRINWELAVMNGSDGIMDEWAYGARIDMDVMGTSSNVEGGYNGAEGTNLNIGLGVNDDGALADGMQMGIDATLTMGGISLSAEMADRDASVGDDSPFSIGLGYLFGANYEAAVRFDDLDTADDTTVITAVVNRYINGHDAKWQLQYSTISSDTAVTETDTITLGLSLGF